jgi:hypothetical protein
MNITSPLKFVIQKHFLVYSIETEKAETDIATLLHISRTSHDPEMVRKIVALLVKCQSAYMVDLVSQFKDAST